jgi:hypothetical protein
MAKKTQKAPKFVDKKNQQRVTLDTILKSVTQNGIIHVGNIKKKWKSLRGIINPKRLIHYLEETKTKISNKSFWFLYSARKDFARELDKRSDLIAI